MSQQNQVIFNGRYELHRRLGRGGMAEVYLARDQLLDRPVAVKVLFPALATDQGFVERFRREAQAAANLQHPNIVSVFDWGEANGTYFIVMEYVEGHTLAEMLRDEGRLHPDRAAEITADIAAALGFAHRNRVVHRDVKPGNVLITRDGGVKVADFGIARALSDSTDQNLTKTGSVMGTATYFSPEQARGAPVDPRSDIYSLGCVLYEMTTGHPPFAGDSAVAIAYKHVQENPIPPRRYDPALPETLEAITLKCLAKNPANRYPGAQDLRADLRRFLDGSRIMAEPVLAPPIDPGATSMMANTQYGDQTALVAGPVGYDTARPIRRLRRLRRLRPGRGAQAVQVVPGRPRPAAAGAGGAAVPAGPQLQQRGPRRSTRSRCRASSGRMSPPPPRRSRPRGSRSSHRVRQRPGTAQPGHRAGPRGRRTRPTRGRP